MRMLAWPCAHLFCCMTSAWLLALHCTCILTTFQHSSIHNMQLQPFFPHNTQLIVYISSKINYIQYAQYTHHKLLTIYILCKKKTKALCIQGQYTHLAYIMYIQVFKFIEVGGWEVVRPQGSWPGWQYHTHCRGYEPSWCSLGGPS